MGLIRVTNQTIVTLYFIIPRTGCSAQLTQNRIIISPDVSTNSIVKVFIKQIKKVLIAVSPLSGFSKKCVDEKTSVERSQSRNRNRIVRGILQINVKLRQSRYQ